MPQRRIASKTADGDSKITIENQSSAPSSSAGQEVKSLSLDGGEEETVPLAESSNAEDENYSTRKHSQKVKKWKESPFAVGLTEPTWNDERTRSHSSRVLPDDTGCLCCSAHMCTLLGAGRVGNMAVLKSSQEWVEEMVEDEETGEQTMRRFTRPRLDFVIGPYWPMLFFVTYPLILGVSGWTFWSGIRPGKLPVVVVFVWLVLTVGLIVALGLTACRDPGILYRSRDQIDSSWRWSDQADSYRPRNAWFDSDTAVVVEEFDHTCPWTGTAIGKKNMVSFQIFVCLIFLCMIMDIFIITGAIH